MAFLLGGANSPRGYNISNSLRFEDADTAWLNRAFSSSGSTTTWTISCWVKRGELGATNPIWAAAPSGGGQLSLVYDANDNLILREYNTTDSEVLNLVTSDKYRDPSAWYHIVASVDTTQGTAANRAKLYINGSQPTLGTATYPDEDYDLLVNATADSDKFLVGTETYAGGSTTFDGYIAEFIFVNNSQLAATSFGEADEDSGIWKPIKPAVTYGTNGLFLEFKQTGTGTDASGMGADTSGNDTHLAPTDLAATDITTDTPTNNFCTLNLLYQQGDNAFSEGNCKVVLEAGDGSKGAAGTIAPTKGKWYWEVKHTASTASSILVREASDREDYLSYYQGNFAGYEKADGNQRVTGNSESTYGASYADGDTVMVALDMDNDKVYFGKGGSWNDGAGNADESSINDYVALSGIVNGIPAVSNANGSATATFEFNFGNAPYSISSGNADANGYGNFEYAVPSGFYALCTKNLAEYG